MMGFSADVRVLLACVLVLMVSGACSQPDITTTVGVLPDGTRYELTVPPWHTMGKVEGISAVPVWADGEAAGAAVGVTNFRRTETLPPALAADGTMVVGKRLVAGADDWAMVIDLYDHSVGREIELEMIEARDRDGLIVLDLPASLRFPEPGEVPAQMAVAYRDLRVVRGCEDYGNCSPDRQIMVTAAADDIDLAGVAVRTLTNQR